MNHKKEQIWKRWGSIAAIGFVLLSLFAFGLVQSAHAAEIREGEEVIVEAGEVIEDDLIISATRIEVNGTVQGDLIASGQEIIVNGTVEGSLLFGGQLLELNGDVEGSVYGGGYALTIGPEANVGRNAYFGGFSLVAESGSVIARDLYAGDYQTLLRGEIGQDVVVGGSALEIDGTVGGNVRGEVSESGGPAPFMPNFPGAVSAVSPGLRIAESADIGGSVNVVRTAAPSGEGQQAPQRSPAATLFRERAGEFIALLIVGGLLLRFWPGMVQAASAKVREKPLPSFGWGFLVTVIFFVAVPIAIIILVVLAILGNLVTFGSLLGDILGVGGATLGFAISVFAFTLAVVSKIIVAYLGGRFILARVAPQMEPGGWTDFWMLVLGVLIYEILRAIPVAGWLIGVVVTLAGLGAIWLVMREGRETAAIPAEKVPQPTI